MLLFPVRDPFWKEMLNGVLGVPDAENTAYCVLPIGETFPLIFVILPSGDRDRVSPFPLLMTSTPKSIAWFSVM